MQILTINIENESILDRVIKSLESFKKDGLEIVSLEDSNDLKLLRLTRDEESISFEDYLKNEN